MNQNQNYTKQPVMDGPTSKHKMDMHGKNALARSSFRTWSIPWNRLTTRGATPRGANHSGQGGVTREMGPFPRCHGSTKHPFSATLVHHLSVHPLISFTLFL